MNLENYEQPTKKRAVPHPLSACADLIEAAGLYSGQYQRGFWLRQLANYRKRHAMPPEIVFTRLIGFLKEIAAMDPKYNKGGRLTNILRA